MPFRVLPLEQPVPLLHRRLIKADRPEPLDPFVYRYLVVHLLLLFVPKILRHGRDENQAKV